MKNVTISIPDNLLKKSLECAQKQGLTLDELVGNLLNTYIAKEKQYPVKKLILNSNRLSVNTKDWKWNRNDLH